MDKAKVLMVGVILVLVVVVGVLGFREATSPSIGPEESYLRVSSVPKCWTGPGWSDNPPYFVGEKYYWWIHVTLCADVNVSDVVVCDGFGGEFVVEGVSFVPIEKSGPYDYTFEYETYELGGVVSVTDGATVWTGHLNETGVAFGDFVFCWSAETLMASFEWYAGSMEETEVRELYVTISTDTNPGGQQEFTSPGTYFLNSGVAAEALIESTGKPTTAESDGIEIEVLEKTELDPTLGDPPSHFQHTSSYRIRICRGNAACFCL